VAANSLDTVLREVLLGADAERRDQAALSALLGADGDAPGLRGRLCEAIRGGTVDLRSGDLQSYLRNSVLAQATIDQPGYAGVQEALGR